MQRTQSPFQRLVPLSWNLVWTGAEWSCFQSLLLGAALILTSNSGLLGTLSALRLHPPPQQPSAGTHCWPCPVLAQPSLMGTKPQALQASALWGSSASAGVGQQDTLAGGSAQSLGAGVSFRSGTAPSSCPPGGSCLLAPRLHCASPSQAAIAPHGGLRATHPWTNAPLCCLWAPGAALGPFSAFHPAPASFAISCLDCHWAPGDFWPLPGLESGAGMSYGFCFV